MKGTDMPAGNGYMPLRRRNLNRTGRMILTSSDVDIDTTLKMKKGGGCP